MAHSSTAVALVCYNRPDFLRPTLRSILSNSPMVDHDLWCFLDGGPGSCQRENAKVVEQELAAAAFAPRAVQIVERPEKIGCGRNIIDARRRVFDAEGYEAAFIFEDDLVVGPHYLGLCERMLAWAERRFSDIGVVQTYNPCWMPVTEKVCRLDEVQVGNPHWWGYLMSRPTWAAICDTLYEYEQRFLQVDEYEHRDHRGITRWTLKKLEQRIDADGGPDNLFAGERPFPETWSYQQYFAGPFCTSQDSMTVLGMTLAGLQKLVTTVNRARPIGSTGLHFCVERFVERRFHEIQLDLFESDATRQQFYVRSAERSLLPAWMRADEVEAIRRVIRQRRPRRVLELGAGGSTVLLAREEGVEEWCSLEPSLAWIDSVLTALAGFPDVRARLVHCPLIKMVERLNELLPHGFEMFFVDGFDRPAALERIRAHLETADGFVLLHDASRPAYREQIEKFPRRTLLTEGNERQQGLMLLEVPR